MLMREAGKGGAAMVLGVLALCAAAPALGNGFESLAQDLSRAARQARIATVAVLPFRTFPPDTPSQGPGIAKTLCDQLARQGGVRAVGPSRVSGRLRESPVDVVAGLGPRQAKKLAALLSVQGLVVGSFRVRHGRLWLEAQLISARTGLPVAAARSAVQLPSADDDEDEPMLASDEAGRHAQDAAFSRPATIRSAQSAENFSMPLSVSSCLMSNPRQSWARSTPS